MLVKMKCSSGWIEDELVPTGNDWSLKSNSPFTRRCSRCTFKKQFKLPAVKVSVEPKLIKSQLMRFHHEFYISLRY